MTKILKNSLFIIICLAIAIGIGYGIGLYANHITGRVSSVTAIDFVKLAKAIVFSFLALIVSAFTHIILHEAGHLVGGLLTGYKFLSFRVFNLTLQREEVEWHWKKFSVDGTFGQCLMHPPHTNSTPFFWYNVAGVLTNLIIAALGLCFICIFKLPMFLFCLCVMLSFVGAWCFISNGIPMTVGGVPNDAKNILILWQNPDQRKYFQNMLAVAAEQSLGKRISELPEEYTCSIPVTKDSSVMEFSARNLFYCRLIDELRFDEARTIAEEIMATGNSLPMILKLETSCDLLLLELASLNRKDVVSNLWNMKFGNGGMTVQKYLKSYSKYYPLKCATLFAYELIAKHSPAAAQPYYNEVKSKLTSYTQPGEARTALAIMEYLLQKRQE